MTLAAPDFETARTMMVDSQLRPNRVTDQRVLDAMRSLPRERFLPPDLAHMAYVDEDVMLGGGRVLVEPMVIARLVQMANAQPGQTALVIGAGAGYGACLLAACGAAVTAVEEDPALLTRARQTLAAFAPTATLVEGRLADGGPAGVHYDIVLIEGAVQSIPAALESKVKPQGGRLVTVLAPQGPGTAVIARHSGSHLRARPEFEANTPLLPQLRPAPAFVF